VFSISFGRQEIKKKEDTPTEFKQKLVRLAGHGQALIEPQLGLSIVDNQEQLISLEEEIQTCEQCSLRAYYPMHKPTCSEYTALSKILLIGEAPRKDEQKEGKPFVGKAGKILFRILLELEFNRSDFYIANVFKCRPLENKLSKDVEKTCWNWLDREIELLQPKLIVALGNTARWYLTGERMGIKALSGQIETVMKMINLIRHFGQFTLLARSIERRMRSY